MESAVESIIDEACILYNMKEKKLLNIQNQLKEIKDKKDAEELQSKLLNNIPIRVSQGNQDNNFIDLKNERNLPAGKFGWCIICRNSANSICKYTNIPVCSNECRNKHMKILEAVESFMTYKDEKDKYIEDALLLFNSICKLSQKDSEAEVNSIPMKSKILSLELTLSFVQNPPENFQNHPEFINLIRDSLSEIILKNSVEKEKQICTLSFSIFSILFMNFRQTLKNEIGVFIEQIFLTILSSDNSSYLHKSLVLEVFQKFSQNPKYILEIFVNYDYDTETRNIFERIIDSLGKVAKGKIGNAKHVSILNAEEAKTIKFMALQVLVSITKNCYELFTKVESRQVSTFEDTKKSSEQEQSKVSDDMDNEEGRNSLIFTEDKYEKALKTKTIINKAVVKFNIKPKNGVNYLIKIGYIAKSPEEATIQDTVNFIKSTPDLNKSKIGEYFGDESEFTKKVMHGYIDSLDFKNMPFVAAMRYLVAEFRLPGESQKIDRILLKFGQKYYQDNPENFSAANAPYELSYAVMILQTTTHNPQVKQKMSFDGFLGMSKDIRRSYNLSDNYMKEIYDDIKQNPITLADDEVAKLKHDSVLANDLKQKRELFERETKHMVKKGRELFQKRKTEVYHYE